MEKETHKVIFDEAIVRYYDELDNADKYAKDNNLIITDIEVVTVGMDLITD